MTVPFHSLPPLDNYPAREPLYTVNKSGNDEYIIRLLEIAASYNAGNSDQEKKASLVAR